MSAYRSHTCAELDRSHVGQTVRLSCWVHRIRDHGGLLEHHHVTRSLHRNEPSIPNSLGQETTVLRRGQAVLRTNNSERWQVDFLETVHHIETIASTEVAQ